MSRAEIFFYGKDFTPLQSANKFQFGYKCFFDGKEKQFNSNEKKGKGIKGILSEISLDKESQFDLLKKFLLKAQENIDELITDKSLNFEEKQIYTYVNQQIYFGGLVGVVCIKNFSINDKVNIDITLQIDSRFDPSPSNNTKEIKSYFLMTLLFNDFVPLNNSQVNSDKDGLTDMLLLYSFIEKYKVAYAKGYFKTYHSFKNNDSKVKGSIDVARHVKTNIGLNNGKICYNHKEKTESNYINHLIVEAYEKLKRKYYKQTLSSFKNVDYLRESIEYLKCLIDYPKYSRKILISKNLNILSHSYYTEYEDMRKICLKILRDEKISVFNGNDNENKVEGILMYIPKLWEKYIENYLHGFRYKTQDKIRILDVNSKNDFRQLTQPDFVFYNDEKPFMILDAKFKPGWMNVATTGEVGSLLLSDYDKCVRDMVTINAHSTGVIFPTNEYITNKEDLFVKADETFEYKHNISKYNQRDKFYTFPIFIPPIDDSFLAWKQKFSENCKIIFSYINCIIKQQLSNSN